MNIEWTEGEMKLAPELRVERRHAEPTQRYEPRGIIIRFPRRIGQLIQFPRPQPATGGAA